MSLYHYMASAKPLPLGARGGKKSLDDVSGDKPPKAFRFKAYELQEGMTPIDQIMDLSHIQDDEIEVYDTMEDAAGIYINSLGPWNEVIKRHFKLPYVYEVAPNWGQFFYSEELKLKFPEEYRASRKCVTELFQLMRDYGDEQNNEFELYSCWTENEHKARNHRLDRFIELNTFNWEDSFQMHDQQYIVVKI